MDFLGIGELRSLGEPSSFEKCLNVLQNQQFVFLLLVMSRELHSGRMNSNNVSCRGWAVTQSNINNKQSAETFSKTKYL
jgi:hypothetical protein